MIKGKGLGHQLAGAVCAIAAAAGILSPRPAGACDAIFVFEGEPDPSRTRVVATVTGYDDVARPIPTIDYAWSLTAIVRQVVSGQVRPGPVEIVLLSVGPDCGTAPGNINDMRRGYPVGQTLVVVGRATLQGRKNVIVMESNKSDFAAALPAVVPRTKDGDLDYNQFKCSGYFFSLFPEFERQRILLAVRKANPEEKQRRLANLALNTCR